MAEPLENRASGSRRHNLSKGLLRASILAFALTGTSLVSTAAISAHYDGKSTDSVTGMYQDDRNLKVSEDYGKASLYLIPAFLLSGLAWGFADKHRREHEARSSSHWL